MLIDEPIASCDDALSLTLRALVGSGETAIWRLRAGKLLYALAQFNSLFHNRPATGTDLWNVYRDRLVELQIRALMEAGDAPIDARQIAVEFLERPEQERGSIIAELGRMLEALAASVIR